jgi:hypothetical protein
MANSLQASEQGIKIAERALQNFDFAKTSKKLADLASSLINGNKLNHKGNVSTSVLGRFWNRASIAKANFVAICKALEVNWEEVAGITTSQEECQEQNITKPSSLEKVIATHDWATFNNELWAGRKELVDQLQLKIQGSCRLLLITGITGIGKTTLSEKLVATLQEGWLSFHLVQEIFDDSTQVKDFPSVAIKLLSDMGENLSEEDRKEEQKLLKRLLQCLHTKHYLLMFQSLEWLLKGNEETGWSGFVDESWGKFFEGFIKAESCKSRIIITSQDLPTPLRTLSVGNENRLYCQLLEGLTAPERLEFFAKRGIVTDVIPTDSLYLTKIGAAYEGHPLALTIIAGEIVNKPYSGDIASYWNKYGHEIVEIEKSQQTEVDERSISDKFQLDRFSTDLRKIVKIKIERTFERLCKEVPTAYQLLCLAAEFRHPVPEDWWLEYLCSYPFNCSKKEQEAAISALRDRYLLEKVIIEGETRIRQHNLIRSVALEHRNKMDTQYE